jgi:alpha-methylacyl-CoA racemase
MTALPGRPLAGVGVKFKGLSRVRVLDFSKLLPGPYATQVLADMGCKVTRVELPHFPDPAREMGPRIDGVGCLYWMVNQGKKQLLLDFRKPAGLKRLKALVAKTDVLVEGFRPGLMDRVGLGYKELSKLNKKLVYCSLMGYPAEGPWARKAGHDLNFQAVSGMLGLGNSEGRVAFPAAQAADLTGSLAAVAGVLAGLHEAAATGRGRHLKIAMAQAAHSLLAIPLSELAATGAEPAPGGNWWTGSNPFYSLYETADGRLLAVAALERSFTYGLLDALGLPRELETTPEAARKTLTETFRSAPLAVWEERLKDKDVCVTGVRTLSEARALFGG